MSRSRPDLQYVVALMASRVSKNPKVVNQIGHRLLDYLCQTANYCLVFRGSEEPDDEVNVFTDSLFVPAGARSHGAAVVTYKGTPICWRSSRQTLVTLSTAESELVEAVEGALLLKSVEGVIQEIAGLTPRLTIRVDNMSAMQLLNGSSGSWRTRHLRLRSSWLKEQVSTGQMRVLHEPGETQLADLGTKPLPRQRLQELVALWRLKDSDRKVRTLTTETAQAQLPQSSTTGLAGLVTKLLLLAQGLCGVAESSRVGEVKDPLPVESSIELYVLILMLIVCAVAFWEARRACLRTGSNAVRLRALSASQRAAPKPKPKTSHKPRTLTKAECKELSAYCERDPAEPLPPAEAARFAELLAKLDQGSESFRAQTKAQASTAAEIRQPAGEVESRASASTAARTAECGVQTDFALGFTRMTFSEEYMPTPTVRIVETSYEGPFFCTASSQGKIHIDSRCWGLRNVPHPQQREMCANCLARLRAQTR